MSPAGMATDGANTDVDPDPDPDKDGPLAERDQIELLRIARATLSEFVFTGDLPPGAPHRPALLSSRGAAVVLSDEQGRRGPLLRMHAGPLYLAIEELVAEAAALGAPLDANALDQMRIGLGVLLSPPVAARPEALVVGRDAVMITRGARRGIVLPWNSEGAASGLELLQLACKRAALPLDGWQAPDVEVLSAPMQSFGQF